MLEALRIRDLGVIRDVAVEFGPGLNAVTGETGAGKTMVVTGLNLLFGGRADVSRVRAGADAASVEGRVRVTPGSAAALRALDAGGEVEDGELLLRRSVTGAGRSRAHVGGTSTPVSVLAELGEEIIVVHGQADQLRLNRPGAQRNALDRFAGIDTEPFRSAFAAWRAADAALTERMRDRGVLVREADLLAYGVAEIDAAAPQADEDLELARLAARLAAADDLRLAARAAHDALLGDADDPASDAADVRTLLTFAQRRLEQSAAADPALGELTERLGNLVVAADDLGAELAAYAEGIDADPGRLARTETRRAELAALIRKYAEPGGGTTGVLAWAEQARDRLDRIDTSDEALAELTERRDRAEAAAAAGAHELSRLRTEAASRLAEAVTAELHGLAMADAQLHVFVRSRVPVAGAPSLPLGSTQAIKASRPDRSGAAGPVRAAAGPDGVDEVEFALQAHADAAPIALQKGASGGELSRVMLGLEVVLAGTDPVPVMVFDEVDAGVGGRAAVEVGRRLARLGRAHQVIVVTHLAQVAAFADRQLAVRGTADPDTTDPDTTDPDTAEPDTTNVDGADPDPRTGRDDAAGRTVSQVVAVDGPARVAELARMLAGRDTEAAREHAAELLADAARSAHSSAPSTTAIPRPRRRSPRR